MSPSSRRSTSPSPSSPFPSSPSPSCLNKRILHFTAQRYFLECFEIFLFLRFYKAGNISNIVNIEIFIRVNLAANIANIEIFMKFNPTAKTANI